MANALYDTLFAPHRGSEAVFLHLPDGSTVTYGRFLGRIAQFAHILTAQGLRPGDRLAAQIHKSPDALALYGACVQAGIIFLPLNTAYTGAELGYFLENSGASLLICDPDLTPDTATPTLTLTATGTGTLTDAATDKPTTFDTVPRGPDDLAAFLYTSGTTGRSKGAMLSHKNLLSNAQTLATHWRFTADDTLLHALPIFHTHGLFVGTNIMLLTGGSMVFLPKLDTDQLITHMPQATTMMGVPTFYTRLLADPRFDAKLTAHMRLFISGSAPLLADTHTQFETRTGHRILERYGMTETNMNTSNPYDGERRAGTVGQPLPGVELRIADPDTGAPLPRGEIGQIEVRGDNVFQGYWQMPEKTAEELRPDGFFQTGDLAREDEDGYIHIVGRAKDLIISGGYNVYAKEVESLLDAFPGVLESAVVAAPHPDLGEAPVAILARAGDTDPDTDSLAQSLQDTLARFKQPRHYLVVDALPRNTMGKVQKAALRATVADVFQPS